MKTLVLRAYARARVEAVTCRHRVTCGFPLNLVTPMADTAPIPRLALTREEAAAAIGMSLDSFERHVQPTLRLVRLGRLRLIPYLRT